MSKLNNIWPSKEKVGGGFSLSQSLFFQFIYKFYSTWLTHYESLNQHRKLSENSQVLLQHQQEYYILVSLADMHYMHKSKLHTVLSVKAFSLDP